MWRLGAGSVKKVWKPLVIGIKIRTFVSDPLPIDEISLFLTIKRITIIKTSLPIHFVLQAVSCKKKLGWGIKHKGWSFDLKAQQIQSSVYIEKPNFAF